MEHKQLPILLEKDEDGMYIAECPALEGCYSQGITMDEALKNVQEAIELCLEEKNNKQLYEEYKPRDLSFHLVTV
ncbi:MAG: type II toxin-antitoxin system HicB family antitoxin [bacterium]|nr:type II toxin-antitoxin system HicB family antitoxin [bacterium]